MSDATTPAQMPSMDAAPGNGRRKRLLLGVLIIAVVGGLVFLLWWLLVGSHHVSTDDAYVGGNVGQVTPLVSAAVVDVRAFENQHVRKGQVLLVLDDADTKIALAAADAAFNQARRKVEGYSATDSALTAQIGARDADIVQANAAIANAQAARDKAMLELRHREALSGTAAIAGEEVTAARAAYVKAVADLKTAQAKLAQAQAERQSAAASFTANHVLTAGAPLGENPEVAAARARRDQAALDLSRTVLRAPFDGVVAKKNVEIGQRVPVGGAVMSVVPVLNLYVDANFKETQLKRIRVGQEAELTSDTYGSGVVYHGRVTGIGAGTGSAFALIPAQNATGNWIKVVQRVPVRISLDPRELKAHPLAVGASMDADVTLN